MTHRQTDTHTDTHTSLLSDDDTIRLTFDFCTIPSFVLRLVFDSHSIGFGRITLVTKAITNPGGRPSDY